jgi:hypothetical protein
MTRRSAHTTIGSSAWRAVGRARPAGATWATWAATGVSIWFAVCTSIWAVAGQAADAFPPDRLPRGVLDTEQGGFLPGRFAAVPAVAGGRDTFAWRSPAFATPFEFFIDEVVGVRFGPSPAAVAAGPWRIILHGGDSLTGTLESLDADTVTLGFGGRKVGVRRGHVQLIGRTGAPTSGAVPAFGWSQVPAGSWREDAGGWATNRRGVALQRDVAVADRVLYDVVLTWAKQPGFRIALSADERTRAEPFRVELFPSAEGPPIDSLVAIREEGTRAAIKAAADAIPEAARQRLPGGRLRLLMFVDQARGRLAVALPESGDDAALIDLTLPVDAGRRPSRRFRLTSGGDVRLESLQVIRWTEDAAVQPRREGTTIGGAAGPLATGDLEAFDAASGEFVVRDADGPRRVPVADVTEIMLPIPGGRPDRAVAVGPPAVRVACLHDQSVSGRLLKIDDEAVWLEGEAFVEPLPVPHAGIVSLAAVRRAAEHRPLPTRVATLRQDGLESRGCLVAGAGDRLAWQPLGSRNASAFVAGADGPDAVVEYVARAAVADEAGSENDVGGMGGMVSHDGEGHCVVTRLSPDGAAARDGRIEVGDRVVALAPEKGSAFVETKGIELDDVMNLLRGRIGSHLRLRVVDGEGQNPREVELVRGALGIQSAEILRQALEAHARLAPGEIEIRGQVAGFPAMLFLRSGDVMPCAVAGIGPDGIRIRTPAVVGDPPLVPAPDVTAVELLPQAASRKIEPARRDRLLTLPRSQRVDPPTHIVRLADGDYLRGQVLSLDDAQLVIAVAGGEEKRLPRATVARVIWLHPEELEPDAAPPAGRRAAGPRAQGVAENGTRITVAVDDMQEGRIRGRIAAIGPGVIDVDAMDRVLLGAAIDREAGSLPYQQWKLKPAPEPRALRGRRDANPQAAQQRIPLSALAGRPAPAFSLPVIDGKGGARGRATPTTAPGRVLVFELWSEWSAPARETLPGIVAAVRAQPAGTVDFVAVSVGDEPARAAAALESLGLASTAIDQARAAAGLFEVRDVPARVIIGADGLVVDVLRGDGPQAVEEFRSLLAATVAAAGPLRKELGRLDEARMLGTRGDRECLEQIASLLSSPHTVVRRESVALLRRLAPTAVSIESTGAARLTADVRLGREVAAWKRWIAREGLVAQLRPVVAPADRQRQPVRELGRRLLCMPFSNQIAEFSADGQKVWGRAFKQPGAGVGLPNGHRLVGSAAAPGRVVEFDDQGKEVWQIADLQAGVTALARLADGNTLVGFGDAQRVAEYDEEGRAVWEVAVVGRPCALFRLEEGTTLVACQESDRIVEIDREGNEITAIEDLNGLQGAVRLADGHVLAALTDKVVELDAAGTVVWSKEGFNAATGIDRLEDGRTLVLEAQTGSIVEFDATGTERGRKRLRGIQAATRLDAY